MYAFASDVSDKIEPSDFNEKLWNTLNWRLGWYSNIIGGIQRATTDNPNAHIYLITDMVNNEGDWEVDNKFSGTITVLEYKTSYNGYYTDKFFEEISNYYPNSETIERKPAN